MSVSRWHNQQVGDAIRQQWVQCDGDGYYLEDTAYGDEPIPLTKGEALEALRQHRADKPFDPADAVHRQVAATR